jgi:hypothetical protein
MQALAALTLRLKPEDAAQIAAPILEVIKETGSSWNRVGDFGA